MVKQIIETLQLNCNVSIICFTKSLFESALIWFCFDLFLCHPILNFIGQSFVGGILQLDKHPKGLIPDIDTSLLEVEQKIPKEYFRVLREKRISVNSRMGILDFVGDVAIVNEILSEIGF